MCISRLDRHVKNQSLRLRIWSSDSDCSERSDTFWERLITRQDDHRSPLYLIRRLCRRPAKTR